MLTALTLTTEKVVAQEAEKNQGPFFCPECGQMTILKKGRVIVHHFAHKPPTTCQYGTGESEAHRQAKGAIYAALLNNPLVINLELERKIGNVRPDIYFELNSRPCAIEVQISSLTMDKIIERTTEYGRLGIALLWLPVFSDELISGKYSIKAWEKWLHAAYFGRVYYWIGEARVNAVEMGEYQLYAEETEWGGGYSYKSKRFRTPINRGTFDLPHGFKIQARTPWQSGPLFIPGFTMLVPNV